MKSPKISIITPSYNQGQFIEDAIKSVLSQNYPDFEHIIIDGCSTDGTVEVLKKHSHLKWISEPDEGQSDALNKGFKMASGEIIGWLNGDDIYLPKTLQKVSNILKDEKIDGIYSNVYFSDERLNITRRLKSHKPVRWLSLFHCFIPSATFFFKRRIIDDGILIDKHKHITMDKDFFARILYAGYRLQYVDDCFSVFRWHTGNKSLDSKETREIRYREGFETLSHVKKLNLPLNIVSMKLYSFLMYAFIPYRKFLKWIS